jgi:hypothetical protein
MSTATAMKALFHRLGATTVTSAYIVDSEGYDSLSKLSELTKTRVDTFCKNVRSPGGRTTTGDSNRGHHLSDQFQIQLHRCVFYLKTKRRVSRTLEIGDVTLDKINTTLLNMQRETEAEYTNPTEIKVEINKQDWPKTLSMFAEALGAIKGYDGNPLSYCVRETLEVDPEDDDPATNYPDLNSEMRVRAPIVKTGLNATGNVDTFTMDNPIVWHHVRNVFENTSEWPHIREYMKHEDGRGAIVKLRSIKMGTQYVQNQSGEIERKQRELTWSGDKRGWKFHDYATQHKHYHGLLADLEGYQEPDEGTRVRQLLNGIKTTMLDSAKNNIYASETLRTDFDGAVAQFSNFLGSMPSSGPEHREQRRNASELSSHGGGKGPQDRYYTDVEYKNFSKIDKQLLFQKREKAKKASGKGGKDDSKGGKKPYQGQFNKALKDQNKIIEKQGRHLAKLASQMGDASSDESATATSAAPAASAGETTGSNRNSPALRRSRRTTRVSPTEA